jgi:hypothetical protein
VGPLVGPEVGPVVGPDVGPLVGPEVGPDVGPEVGPDVGPPVGPDVGSDVGSDVGVGPVHVSVCTLFTKLVIVVIEAPLNKLAFLFIYGVITNPFPEFPDT